MPDRATEVLAELMSTVTRIADTTPAGAEVTVKTVSALLVALGELALIVGAHERALGALTDQLRGPEQISS